MISSAILEKTYTSELFEVFEELTSAVFSKIAQEIMLFLIMYVTKLCRTESHASVTCKIMYSLNCQYFNKEKTFVS